MNMPQSIEWVFDELGPLVSQPGCPLLQPTINLMGQLIRPDHTQQRPNQELDQHRQQLNIVITEKRSNALKIATQIGLDDREGADAEVIDNGYLPLPRSVKYATSGQRLAAPRFSWLEYPRNLDRTPSTGRLIAAGHQPPGYLLLGSGQRLRHKVEFIGGLVVVDDHAGEAGQLLLPDPDLDRAGRFGCVAVLNLLGHGSLHSFF